MPRELRSYDFRKDDYNIWALVRRCIKTKDANGQPRYSIGVAFVGKTPPDDYLTHPASTFILSNEEPENNDFWRVVTETIEKAGTPVYDKPRRQSRLQIPEEVTLKLMDENGWEVAWETSVTQNISKGGAEVLTQLPVNVGSFVRFSTSRNNVQLISVVRGKHTGQGGVSTINLEFIDMHYPIDLHA